jgi:methylmalonyl-CoA epimerase
MAKITRINHIAITTNSINHSLRLWQDCLGLEMTRVEDVPGMNLTVAFLPVGESSVEFLVPMESKTWEDVDPYFRERQGMNHICFEVDDIDQMMDTLKQNGIKLIHEQPLQLKGRKLSFLDPASTDGVLVELYELTPGVEAA